MIPALTLLALASTSEMPAIPSSVRTCIDVQVDFLADHYRYRTTRRNAAREARSITAFCSKRLPDKKHLTQIQFAAEVKRITPTIARILNDPFPPGDVINAEN